MLNLRLTAYSVCLLFAMVNPVFAEDEQTRAIVLETKVEMSEQEVVERIEQNQTEKESLTEKENQNITAKVATIIETSMSQQQAEASMFEDVSENKELPQVSFLEVMDALAQFGDDKKLSDYIAQYYEQNPEVAQNKYPNLAYDAAITGMLNLLKYLIKHNPEKTLLAYENGPTVLGYIAGDNQVDAAKLLLESQFDPNDAGNTDQEYPLYLAINSGNLQMITLLMDYGAKVHIGDRFHSPLGLLLDNNDLQILNVIHAYDFKLESTNADFVRLLIDYLNSELVEEEVLSILLTHGFDPYEQNAEGKDFFAIADEQIKTKDVLAMLKDLSTPSVSSEDQVEAESASDDVENTEAKASEVVEDAVVEKEASESETSSSDEDSQEKDVQKEEVTQ